MKFKRFQNLPGLFRLKRPRRWLLQFLTATAIFMPCVAASQNQSSERDPYILRDDDKLDIAVHIWGEVQKPGEYIVPDGTNALELISIAGGPTDFSNLSKVVITRSYSAARYSMKNLGLSPAGGEPSARSNRTQKGTEVINLNLKDYLDGGKGQASIFSLQPGDVIRIKRNSWHKWTTTLKVVTQAAIILQAVYWYSRIK